MIVEDVEFEPLKAEHTFGGFSCGNADIDRFLKTDRAYIEQCKGLSSTTLVCYKGIVVGFYTARCTQVEMKDEERLQLEVEYDQYAPAVEITFLAVDKHFQNEGLGSHILNYIFADCVELTQWLGVKYLFLWAVPEAVSFYKKKLFVETDVGETKNQIAMRLPIPYYQSV